MKTEEQERAEWETKHPSLDYDEYIDGLITQHLEEKHEN